jgi:hypothetical protein
MLPGPLPKFYHLASSSPPHMKAWMEATGKLERALAQSSIEIAPSGDALGEDAPSDRVAAHGRQGQ